MPSQPGLFVVTGYGDQAADIKQQYGHDDLFADPKFHTADYFSLTVRTGTWLRRSRRRF
jgi:hypothetical protein